MKSKGFGTYRVPDPDTARAPISLNAIRSAPDPLQTGAGAGHPGSKQNRAAFTGGEKLRDASVQKYNATDSTRTRDGNHK